MRRILLISVLCLSLSCCSGCAMLIGGIIGYQSGELLAGVAIGAGLQYGGAIANGIGEMLADPVNDVSKAEIDSAAGRINLPKSAFTASQLRCLMSEFQVIFNQNQWQWKLAGRKSKANQTDFMEKWACKTRDGVEFDMTVLRHRNSKPSITINVTKKGNLSRDEITIQIFNWLSSAVKRKC